jgi:hypothetical protein
MTTVEKENVDCCTTSTSSSGAECCATSSSTTTPNNITTSFLASTPCSSVQNLRAPNRSLWIITTASVPWLTGTAVNPLYRAISLASTVHPSSTVTLVVPWLVREEDRLKLYGSTTSFTSWQEQERWIRTEFTTSSSMTATTTTTHADNLYIEFYDSIYLEAIGSILPLVDIPTWIISTFCDTPTSSLPNLNSRRRRTADVAILEEPEHLNFVRYTHVHWTDVFRFVIGIIHTNYPAYASLSAPSFLYLIPWLSEQAMIQFCNWLVQRNCHFILRLSGALPPIITNNQTNNDDQAFSRDVICNVHGVQQDFISTTITSASSSQTSLASTTPIYYIGKLLWVKGFHYLLDIEEQYRQNTGNYFPIDIYGAGPEEDDIKQSFLGHSTAQEPTSTASATTNSTIFHHSLRQLVTEQPRASTPLMSSPLTTPTAQLSSKSSILLSATEGSFQYTAETCKAFFKLIQLPVALKKSSSYQSIDSIPSVFFGVQRHLRLKDMPYKVFLNPSVSEGA